MFKGLCTDHPNRSIHPVNMATPRHLLQRVPETQLLTAPNSTHPSLLGSNLASLLPPGHQGHLSSISFLCCCSVAQLCQALCNPWTAASQGSLSFPISLNLLTLISIELVMPSNNLILCCPLVLLPSIFPSTRVFSNELALCISWPKYWSFSLGISPSNEYLGLIYFRMDLFHLLLVQGTLKCLLQQHSSKAPVLQRSAFFMVQLSYPYVTIGKTIALIIWTFVGKVMNVSTF